MSFKKLVVAVSAAMLLAFPAVAQDKITIGVSWDEKESSLVTAWEDFMRAHGADLGAEAGVEVEFIFNVANSDPARQAANIEDLINRGVDIILARAWDSAAVGSSIRAADAAGVPFITFDRPSSTIQPIAHVGGDSYDQAVRSASALVGILTKEGVKGRCIEMVGALVDENAVFRSQGWQETDTASLQIETLAQVPTEWNPELFLSGLTNALNAHPDANCLFIASDFAFQSVQAALEAAGKYHPIGHPDHVYIATCDLEAAAVVPMEQGYIDVSMTWNADAQAREAVRVALAIVGGEDPGCGSNGCLAKGQLITPSTIGEVENLWSREY